MRPRPVLFGQLKSPEPEGQVSGVEGIEKLEPSMAETGQKRRSPTAARGDIRLVDRGLCHSGPARGPGANAKFCLTRLFEVLQRASKLLTRGQPVRPIRGQRATPLRNA